MLAKQGGLKPFFDQPLARPGDRVDTGLQRRRDLAVAPARTTLRGVSFQQDAGLQQLLCRMFPAMDKGGELLSFLIAECHNVLLYRDLFSGHEPAPSLVTEASRQKIDVESMTDTTITVRSSRTLRRSTMASFLRSCALIFGMRPAMNASSRSPNACGPCWPSHGVFEVKAFY